MFYYTSLTRDAMMLYLLFLVLALISPSQSYNSPGCPRWPSYNTWQIQLGSLLSRNARLHGPMDPNSFFDECTTLGTDAYAINKAGNGICMHLYACAYEFCRPDRESSPAFDLPAYVVEAKTSGDVSKALQFAGRHDIAVSVKTTGHSYMGSSSVANSLLIWMQNFPKDGTITRNYRNSCGTTYDVVVGVNGGEVWDDVIDAIGEDYHMVTGGARSVSAAGGWLQGVGLSFSSRKYGTGIDNVVDFDVVLASGLQVRADACTNPDLFWALRGGGGGTFGVVTHVNYKLYPKTPIVVIDWKLRDYLTGRSEDKRFAYQWLAYWISVSPNLDNRWSGFFHPFGLHLVFSGAQAAADTTFLNDLDNWYYTTLDRSDIKELRNPKRSVKVYSSWYDYLGGAEGKGNPDATVATGDWHVGVEYMGARLMPKSLVEKRPGDVLNFLMDLLEINFSYVNYFLGGQINDVDEAATAVHPAMRNAIWAVHSDSDEATQRVREFLPNSITGVSFNHHQTTEPNWTEALWGENYVRLLELKLKYDPKHVFNCWHCVGYQGRELGEPRSIRTCPTDPPTPAPSKTASASPSEPPTISPSVNPSKSPSSSPTPQPSVAPSEMPSQTPSQPPSVSPTISPSVTPSRAPSLSPSEDPSAPPSEIPSDIPSATKNPTASKAPSAAPSASMAPSSSGTPSCKPSLAPSEAPSVVVSEAPSKEPSVDLSKAPSTVPSPPPTASRTIPLSYCFSGDMQVRVRLTLMESKSKGTFERKVVTKKMKNLSVGDSVLVNNKGQYEPVYAFGHFDPNLESKYLKLEPSGLKLSKDHMVFILGKRAPVPASNVKVGDILVSESGRLEAVTSIQTIVQDGAYAPFTSSGTIMVNGIQSSTFVAFQESDTLMIGGIKTGLTYQWMARSFELPHKWTLRATSRYSNGKPGISWWVSGPLAFAQWWLTKHESMIVMALVALPVVLSLFVLAVVEWIVTHPSILILLIMIGSIAVTVMRRHNLNLNLVSKEKAV